MIGKLLGILRSSPNPAEVRIERLTMPPAPSQGEIDELVAHVFESKLKSAEWKVGDRVLANWYPQVYFYAATITGTFEGQFHVRFDDGDEALCTSKQLRRVSDLKVGDMVYDRNTKKSGIIHDIMCDGQCYVRLPDEKCYIWVTVSNLIVDMSGVKY